MMQSCASVGEGSSEAGPILYLGLEATGALRVTATSDRLSADSLPVRSFGLRIICSGRRRTQDGAGRYLACDHVAPQGYQQFTRQRDDHGFAYSWLRACCA